MSDQQGDGPDQPERPPATPDAPAPPDVPAPPGAPDPRSPYGAAPAAFGSPPQEPVPAYGTYGPSPYGQQYGGAPPYQQPYFGPPPLPEGVSYASWGARFGAWLIDLVALVACLVPGIVTSIAVNAPLDPGEDPGPVGVTAIVVFWLGGVLSWLYQYTWRQGARGRSWGKQVVGIDLVSERDFRPPGGGWGLLRWFLRVMFGYFSCSIYTVLTALWPLWDERSQTLDDKIVKTLVVRLPT